MTDFLKRLLATPGPAGDEAAAGRLWRAYADGFADRTWCDVRGSSYAVLEGGSPRVLLAGHIDEIGVMVTHIDDSGYLWFAGIGGWDPQVLVGQRVRLLGRQGDVIGVVGRKPIHLLKSDERERVAKLDDLWIDIGVDSRADAQQLVRVGSVGVVDGPIHDLPNRRLVSRGLDNRIGAFVVVEALRLLAASARRPPWPPPPPARKRSATSWGRARPRTASSRTPRSRSTSPTQPTSPTRTRSATATCGSAAAR